ncbi:MAG TPA: HAD family hydrolase [Arthrobacter sp.]
MTVLFASDLDRTLIYSPAALWLGDAEDPDLQTVPVLFKEGVPGSAMTATAARLLAGLPEVVWFVPTTARGMDSYRRIALPGAPYEYAITSTGGNILHNGEQDHDWSASIRRALTETAPVEVVHSFLSDAAFSWILGLGITDGLFLHSRIERAAMPADWLLELETRCLAWGWQVSVQGRKLYCTPKPVDKRLAVEEIRRRTGAVEVIAAGDSLLDKGMLEAADSAYRPAHGELAEQGWLAPHLTVTVARGIRAGEEILQSVTRTAMTVPTG